MSQFGQAPLAAYLPLRAGQNLADLPDKAAALANLGTLSSSDIMLNGVPIGTIIPFWGSVAPAGYLPCVGQTINSSTFPNLVTFLGGTTSATVPDLRGEFLRGWDNGRGVDLDRAVKTTQLDQFQGHMIGDAAGYALGREPSGSWPGGAYRVAGFMPLPSTSYAKIIPDGVNGTPRTGAETRPRNVSVLYCIKAYGAAINVTTANLGNVLTELSQTAKITQFENSLGTSGYQKLPNGLIIQWGFTSAVDGGSVSFPISFPTACVALSLTDHANGSPYYVHAYSTRTVSGFVHKCSDAVSNSFDFIAIGY